MKSSMEIPSFKFRHIALTSGLIFLYLPIVVLMGYSFNASRIADVWAGFSFKWYDVLLHNSQLLGAAWMSIRIAFCSATMAIILGVMASYVIVRYRRFRGKSLFSSMMTAPLVMPDVILGISLLLMFVSLAQVIGWPQQRGFLTIWLAHVTFCTSYATVVISSRLQDNDKTLENAAMDLGAGPLKTFFSITLPLLFPALASAWLLSFTLSLDDVVVASFVTGPGATTLPMVVLSSIKLGVSPQINALATLIILVVSFVTLIAWWLMHRADKQRRQKA